tara:strand:- start:43819 stop:45150 length:1332 start_codon:yes stop_codon:yes gene_type:complete
MDFFEIDWTKKHVLKTNTRVLCTSDEDELSSDELKGEVEPWLSAIFQSEHLSVLIGSGLTSAVSAMAGVSPQEMWRLKIDHDLGEKIKTKADQSAESLGRGEANIEDDIRVMLELINGLKIIDDDRSSKLEEELNKKLRDFISEILRTERELADKIEADEEKAVKAFNLLKSFILSFSSRSASRERLNIFTTNYDRFIELACDETGVLLMDRFKGKLRPIFRNTRLELDYHYNPPGIRGEPRYAEGVAKITKLHGSIDWRFYDQKIVREALTFGATEDHPSLPKNISDNVVIYPNSSKDLETAFYPYAELFRDFSTAACQPNSVIITYGYGFGDSHINRVIEDMLTIPSTHLVIIAWDIDSSKEGQPANFGSGRDRIIKFLEDKNSSQCTLMIGEHFGDLSNLVNYYLPKSAIDRLTIKMQKLKANRGDIDEEGNNNESKEEQ